MDLANYIVELLGAQGEVCVPGLGCFVKTRVNGHYDEKENKFFPPANKVTFDPQIIEDDGLVNYISARKKISTTSSAYFVEKYITSLKEQIALYEVAFTDMGWLYSENGKLVFKAKENFSPVDPDFFGYPALKLLKKGKQEIFEQQPKLEDQTTIAGAPAAASSAAPAPSLTVREMLSRKPSVETIPAPPEPEEQTVANPDEEVELENRSTSPWLIAAIALVLIAGALFALYQFKPRLFDAIFPSARPSAVAAPAVIKPVAKPDTAAKKPDSTAQTLPVMPDSAKKAPAAVLQPIDYTKVKHWEIISAPAKDSAEAKERIANFQKIGIKAKTIRMEGKLIHISIGTYMNEDEAKKAKAAFIASGKVRKDIYVKEFNLNK